MVRNPLSFKPNRSFDFSVKAEFNIGDKSLLMVGVANPTDFRTKPGAPKTILAQFATGSKDDKFKAYFNFQGGNQGVQSDAETHKKLVQGDVVLTYAVSAKFSLGYNGTLQSVQLKGAQATGYTKYTWWGSALYVNADPVSWFGLTLRGEYIGDKDEYLGLKRVFAPTLSANFKIDNLTIIPEFRMDNAGKQAFFKNAAETTKSTGSFILAATYHF